MFVFARWIMPVVLLAGPVSALASEEAAMEGTVDVQRTRRGQHGESPTSGGGGAPTPEPGTVSLVVLSAVGLTLAARRRRRPMA